MEQNPTKRPVTSKTRAGGSPVAASTTKMNHVPSARPHVLPERLTPDLVVLLRQTLQINALVSALTWIVDRIPDSSEPLELAEHLADRYEQQMLRLKQESVKDNMSVFRAAFAVKCLEILPVFSMRMAQAGYNPLFLRIWFQKRLLAELMGITVADVERRARTSGTRISVYLSDQIAHLYPQTCLGKQLKEK